jgi:DNA-cytosine methyltransferase
MTDNEGDAHKGGPLRRVWGAKLRPMRFLSLFSGVGGMDLGLERAGHTIAAMCEIDSHARSILRKHWPNTPIHTDVTELDGSQYRGRIDAVSGGSPCQDLSVAGRRAGLDGSRSGLFWHQCRIADQAGAKWVIWENVPGALTSNRGADFAAVLWGLTGTLPDLPDGGKWRTSGVVVGPKRWAVWRVLDAQHFGVPQRRRRVFVVASATAPCRPEILLESESLRRNHSTRRTPRQEIAGTLGSRLTRNDLDTNGAYIVDKPASSATVTNSASATAPQMFTEGQFAQYIPGTGTIRASGGTYGGGSENLIVEAPQVFGQSGFAGYTEGVATLSATGYKRPEDNLVTPTFVKVIRSGARDENGDLPPEVWAEQQVAPTLNQFDNGGESRATVLCFGWQEQHYAGDVHVDQATALTTTKTQAVFIPEAPQPATNFDEYNFTGGEEVHHSIRAGTKQSTGVVLAPSLTASNDPSRSPQSSEVTQQVEAVVRAASIVRRLTPVECERLMGWPDNWTQVRDDGKQQADSHRYKQCGNGVVANVAEWIGSRL